MAKEDVKPIPDKETKPKTIDTKGTTPKTESKGEYTEEKKASLKAMKSYYGDTEINDGNYMALMESMVAKDYGPTKEKNKVYEEGNKSVLAMLDDNPAVAAIHSDMADGAKFEQVLPKYVDLEALTESQSGEESYGENKKLRMERFNSRQKRKSMLDANEKKSIETVKKFIADKKMEGENADKFGKFVAQVISDANDGDLKVSFLDAMYKSMNYESDIATTKMVAEVSAKNAKIEEKTKSEADFKKGDGVPIMESADDSVSDESGDDFTKRLGRSVRQRRSVLRP